MKQFFGSFFAISALFLISCSEDIDAPLTSGQVPSLFETAEEAEILTLFYAAISKADESPMVDLSEVLQNNGPFTLFAPTNDAFDALFDSWDGYESLDDFDTDAEKELLSRVLLYHLTEDLIVSASIQEGQTVTTLQGEDIGFTLGGGVRIIDATASEARVLTSDINTSNGILHLLDKVLLPQEIQNLFLNEGF